MRLFETKSRLGNPLTAILALAVSPALSMAEDPSAAKTIYDIPNLVVRKIQSTNTPLTNNFKPVTGASDEQRRGKTVEQADLAFLREDFTALGWSEDIAKPGDWWCCAQVSNDGKILYNTHNKWDQPVTHWNQPAGGKQQKAYVFERATIVFDPAVQRKWVIRNMPVPERKGNGSPNIIGYINCTQLSPNSKILFIGLSEPTKYTRDRGTAYFIKLDDMTVLYQHRGCVVCDRGKNRFSDDSTLYFTGDGIVDIYAAKFKPMGPSSQTHSIICISDAFAISPNFQYIAFGRGMFSSPDTVEGQWGIEVQTPNNGRLVLSSPTRSLVQSEVKNDGTIIDSRGFVFRFENETYRCVHEPAQLPLGRLNIAKEDTD